MHIPERMCAACRQMKPKHELIRLVKRDNVVMIDGTGKIQARGVYMCKDAECVRLGRKKRSLERAFRCAVNSDVYDKIEAEVQ